MAREDVLSAGEIDALMESVDNGADGAGAPDDGEYRRFDFTARERSALREFTALDALVERQAALLAAEFETVFSIEAQVRAEAPLLRTVADTGAALGACIAVSQVELAPFDGGAVVITPGPLISFVVNRYFGGGSLPSPAASERSSLTPTELRLGERIASLALNSLAASWQDRLAIEPGALQTRAVADAIEALPSSDLLLQLGFTVTAGDVDGRIQVLLPFADLAPHQPRFAPPRKQQEARDEDASWAPFFRRELPRLEIEVVACLASRPIALAELLSLSRGSVVPLPAPGDVSLQVEGVTLAEGRYGSFEGMKAVQLERLGRQTRN
ncbi:MAG: FliM/FliN family flagellar motor switch protein [Halieaceae bacterium]|jgi:flagellar motor switch protein FliM|nr:FliM/FliN family flagellar motor switch protein [Halieaceae bacterium]